MLLLIDIHSLLVFLFKSYIPKVYYFLGGSLLLLKGTTFFLMTRETFSLIDIILGIIFILNLFFNIGLVLKIIIVVYLSSRILSTIVALV